jgi:hypothetical protein
MAGIPAVPRVRSTMAMFGLIHTSSHVMKLPAFMTWDVAGDGCIFHLTATFRRTSLDALLILMVMSCIHIANLGLLSALGVGPSITGALFDRLVV